MRPPNTQYTKSGDVHIAYQVFGEGEKDLIFCPGTPSQIEHFWEEPSSARWLDRLGSFARVVLFDKRGTGLSDRVEVPPMDERMDDIRAVMDAVGIDRASLVGYSEGGTMAAAFSAYHPKRCEKLILYGTFTQWAQTEEELNNAFQYIETAWGSGLSVPIYAPIKGQDPKFQEWWGKYERLGLSPQGMAAYVRMMNDIDITEILPTIKIPTLVLHKKEDVLVDIGEAHKLAKLIPNAKLVEFPGIDHLIFLGEEADLILSEMQHFLTGEKAEPVVDRVLAAVVFTDIVGSTALAQRIGDRAWRELLNDHDRVVRAELDRFKGHEVKSLGDGFLATFDGPGRAIRCANAITQEVSKLGIDLRVGVHTGEVEISKDDVRGIAVHLASRIAELGNKGEVVVSRTVKDLVAGSGFGFEDLGSHQLKGISEEWQVYRALEMEAA